MRFEYGEFAVNYHQFERKFCLTLVHGDVAGYRPLVKLHSACLFAEAFHSLDCTCGLQLDRTLRSIQMNQRGVVVYSYDEGRGIGLENKIKALEIERTTGLDSFEAVRALGLVPDARDYVCESAALREIGTNAEIILISHSEVKWKSLTAAGFNVVDTVDVDG